jgi:hypothetical protein
MACVRKRRVGKGFRWVLDYRDQQGRRHWETPTATAKEPERLLARSQNAEDGPFLAD